MVNRNCYHSIFFFFFYFKKGTSKHPEITGYFNFPLSISFFFSSLLYGELFNLFSLTCTIQVWEVASGKFSCGSPVAGGSVHGQLGRVRTEVEIRLLDFCLASGAFLRMAWILIGMCAGLRHLVALFHKRPERSGPS